MKRVMLLCFAAAFAFFSCEDIQTNDPAFQGNINGEFFRANDSRATMNNDGSWSIQGISATEIMTFRIPPGPIGPYELGGLSSSSATYEDGNGNIYATNPLGSGVLEITARCLSCETLSGTFYFTAINASLDTIRVERGLMFDISFGDGLGGAGNAGSLVADVDGTPFNAVTVSAGNTGNSILVTAATVSGDAIVVRTPVDVVPGNYPIPQSSGFAASYSDGTTTELADSGTIVIIEHNVSERRLRGTFAFTTSEHGVSSGQFNIVYL